MEWNLATSKTQHALTSWFNQRCAHIRLNLLKCFFLYTTGSCFLCTEVEIAVVFDVASSCSISNLGRICLNGLDPLHDQIGARFVFPRAAEDGFARDFWCGTDLSNTCIMLIHFLQHSTMELEAISWKMLEDLIMFCPSLSLIEMIEFHIFAYICLHWRRLEAKKHSLVVHTLGSSTIALMLYLTLWTFLNNLRLLRCLALWLHLFGP